MELQPGKLRTHCTPALAIFGSHIGYAADDSADEPTPQGEFGDGAACMRVGSWQATASSGTRFRRHHMESAAVL
eukprot:COSAG02_NODE_59711_length_273_cov_0.890805_1_plen_74_part_01